MNNGSGDYLIQIMEADGSIREFTQSADSLPELQTKGRLKYNVVSGKSNIVDTDDQYFSQASLYYGIANSLTLYGGTILSSGYTAYGMGAGWLVKGLGAVSADMTLSSVNRLPGDKSATGQSVRASWYRAFDTTATSFGLFAYRYSSEKYMGFEEYLKFRNLGSNPLNKKNRLEVSLNQRLGNYGNLSLSGRKESYWSGERNLTGVRLNHNVGLGRVSLNTYYDQNRTVNNQEDKIFGMSISVSLYERGRRLSLNSRLSRENGRLTNQNAVNFSPTVDGRFTMSASSGKTEGQHSMQGFQGNYSGGLSEISAGYYSSADTRRLSAGLRGGAVIHPRGVTAGRRLSMDAPIAIVSTPGVSGVRVSNRANVETDYFGNAIISHLQPYQKNQVSIDVTSLDDRMDVTETDKVIIPTVGSVIPVQFSVNTGERALFKVMHRNRILPLGAVASVKGQNNIEQTAFFADQGQVYLTGLNPRGTVRVKWGSGDCQFTYDVGEARGQALYNNSVECR